MYRQILLYITLSILTLTACTEEVKSPSYDENLLIGRWELKDAWREKKQTEMLVGTFYEFDQKGTVRTNFTADMVPGEFPYALEGHIIQLEGEPEFSYTIDSLDQANLIFSTNYRGYLFKMALKKAIEGVESETTHM